MVERKEWKMGYITDRKMEKVGLPFLTCSQKAYTVYSVKLSWILLAANI